MPKLSVIMPVHNAADTLSEAIDSVLGQSLEDLELICVDDGSTDESLDILRARAAEEPRMKVIAQENLHAGPARNRGIEAASGEYLHFLDADDAALPYAYEAVCDKADKHGLDLLRCAAVDWDVSQEAYIAKTRNSLSRLAPGDFNRLVGLEPESPLYQVAVAPWAGIVRRDLLLEHDIRFNELVCVNDRSFFNACITNADRMMVSRDRIVLHRVNQPGSLVGNRAQHFDCHFRSIEAIAARMQADGVDERTQERILREEFNDLFHWFVLLADGSERGDAIEAQTADFVEGWQGPFAWVLRGKYRDAVKKLPRMKETGAPVDKKVSVRHEACEEPKVSVVVPIYNVEDYLNEALDSLTKQSLREMEFICVDDGSTDGSAAILREYAALDGRFRVLDGPNGGYGRALNRGIDAARGKWLGILEPDDFVPRNMYAELYKVAEENEVDFVKAGNYHFRTGPSGKRHETLFPLAKDEGFYNRVLCPGDEQLSFKLVMNIWSGIYRLDFLNRWNIRCNETPGASYQDNGFWFQTLARAERALFLPEAYYRYRWDNPGSSIASSTKMYCYTEEYAFIEEWLKQDEQLWERYRSIFYWSKFNAFIRTWRLIPAASQPEYFRHIRDEFAEPLAQGWIDEGLLGPARAERLKRIVEDPEAYAESVQVSVIMPVYNAEKYLRQTLDSILSGNAIQLELICIDDGSSDGSPAILAEYAQRDPRVRVITQKNAGAGAARNAGMRIARGEYLSFLDADDFFEPYMLEKAYGRAFAEKSDVVVFRCDEYDEDADEFNPTDWALRYQLLPSERPFASADVPQNFFKAFMGWTWDKLFRADYVREKGLSFQEQRTTNDLLFTYSALLGAERISTLNILFVHRRIHSGSLSVTREESWRCFFDALLALRGRLEDWGLYERREQDYVNYCLNFSLWNLNTLKGESFARLYNKLKGGWLEELGVLGHEEAYFYKRDEYAQLQHIMSGGPEDFLFWQLERARTRRDELSRELGETKGELKGQRARGRELAADKRRLSSSNKRLEAKNARLEASNGKLKAANERLKDSNARLKESNAKLKDSLSKQRAETKALKSSRSWKIGRAITWIPRKIKGLFRK